MHPIERILRWLKRAPTSAEEVEAAQERARLRDEIETTRVSSRSSAAENYQTGRRSGR